MPWEKAIASLLGPDAQAFSDVTLISTDEKRLPAVRALLAIRSSYFRNLFFTSFAERNAADVKLPFYGTIVQNLLQFAYTDRCDVLDNAEKLLSADLQSVVSDGKEPSPIPTQRKRKRAIDPNALRDMQSKELSWLDKIPVSELLQLAIMADYVEMTLLQDLTCKVLRRVTAAYPETCCIVLQHVCASPSTSTSFAHLERQVRQIIRRQPQHCLLVPDLRGDLRKCTGRSGFVAGCGVLALGEDALASVLKDNDLFASDAYLFQVVYFWATSGHRLGALADAGAKKIKVEDTEIYVPGDMSADEWTEIRKADRWEKARELAASIDLERVKPSFLRTYVRRCLLVDEKRLAHTFELQAMEAERGRACFDNFRGGSVFGNGTKTITETSSGYRNYKLKGPWLRSGRHEWTFKIRKISDCLWLGVTADEIGGRLMFALSGKGWGYSAGGMLMPGPPVAVSAGGSAPKCPEGAQVKMLLNLMKSGTITLSFEGSSKPFLAFRELRGRGERFMPILCLSAPGSVELVEEKHHLE